MSSSTGSSPSSTGGRSRRLLIPLATMVAAGAVIAGSGADFNSTTSSDISTVTAGNFTQDNTATNSAIFEMNTMKPGDTTTGTATVTNTGDFAGSFTLVEEQPSNTFPEGDLELVVTDSANPEEAIYSGTIGSLPDQDLGIIPAGESRTYTFDVSFDAAAGNEAQGATASAVYTWDAVQADDPEETPAV